MKITFFGGARSVTGANYLLEHNGIKILIDCGLNQGSKYADDLNYEPFVYDPGEIDHVLITHSHIDHIGRLPKLCREGFKGKVWATIPTLDLMRVALPDNMQHVFREAKETGREPFFAQKDLDDFLSVVKGIDYHEPVKINDFTAEFLDAGHILGSAIITISWKENGAEKKIAFSGDLGNSPSVLLRPREYPENCDYLVVESAYGDRIHEDAEARTEKLVKILDRTIKNKGILLIPTFAIERTQELLYELDKIFRDNKRPVVPIFLDSPLAIKMTDIYQRYGRYFNKAAREQISLGNDIFNFPGLKKTTSVEESKAINDVPPPKIIIAGSGMSQGGRILHHEVRYLSDPNNTILFAGYQVDGSLGRRIQHGEKTVKIFDREVSVNCRIENISSYSAHADQIGLLEWISDSCENSLDGNGHTKVKKVFVVQGEENAAKTLANLTHEQVGVPSVAPITEEDFTLL